MRPYIDLETPNNAPTYSTYGNGEEILIAFHGYGMDGNQFQVLSSMCHRYKVIGFHLPYHPNGPQSHEGWLEMTIAHITQMIAQEGVHKFSIAGYSVGARIALKIANTFPGQIKHIYLFAPYGFEDHWGLRFVTGFVGDLLFSALVHTSLPNRIMALAKHVGIIDHDLFQIISKELDTKPKRNSLRQTLRMVGKLPMKAAEIVDHFNASSVTATLVYGSRDVLFPFGKRNQKALHKLHSLQLIETNQGHWMMTEQLDKTLSTKLHQY